MYDWDFKAVWNYKEQLFDAFLVTLQLNLAVLAAGVALGVFIGVVSKSESKTVQFLARIYTDSFRALPVLVLLVWFYFCIPILMGGIRISGYTSAIIVLSLNLSAFIAEIVRAGIESVPESYKEDALAAGYSEWQTHYRIVLPVALRIMVPPLVGQCINTAKLSVLASVIAVPELLHRTTDIISQTYRPLEFYTVLAVLFLLLLLPGTIFSRRLEKSADRMKAWRQ